MSQNVLSNNPDSKAYVIKRNISFIAIALSLLAFIHIGQQSTNNQTNSNADKIIGGWISDAKDSQMEIIKSGNQYTGKLIKGWGNEMYETDGKTLRRDTRNPNTKLRNRTLLNMEFISNLIFVNGEYKEGKLYVAQIGTSVKCTMKFEGDNLIMRAYVGLPFLGITKKWSRVRS